MRRHQLRLSRPQLVQHLDGIVGDGGRTGRQRAGQFGDGRGVGLACQRLGQFDIGLLVVAPERRSELAQNAHAPIAVSSARVIISLSDDCRSSALSSAWVIRQSVIVQMASAWRSNRAASV